MFWSCIKNSQLRCIVSREWLQQVKIAYLAVLSYLDELITHYLHKLLSKLYLSQPTSSCLTFSICSEINSQAHCTVLTLFLNKLTL